MGLIRKTLMVGTAGVVSGSSKKQKVAKANLRANEMAAEQMALQTKYLARPPVTPVVMQPSQSALAPLPPGLMLSPDGKQVFMEEEWRPFVRNHVGTFWYNGESWVTL